MKASDKLREVAGRAAKTLGLSGSDGVSFRTKRALLEHGEIAPDKKADDEPASEGKGGPGPSQELRDRVERARKARSEESFRRAMERRRSGQ